MVASSIGVANFCTDVSDSPSFVRSAAAELSRALSTSPLPEARACSATSVSPVAQLIAFKPITYSSPRAEIEPASMALLPTRWHSSRATSPVIGCSGERPIRRSVADTLRSERIFRNGDWSRSTASACFSASSNTASPVLFSKSARTTVSFSDSAVARRPFNQRTPAATSATATAAGTSSFQCLARAPKRCEAAGIGAAASLARDGVCAVAAAGVASLWIGAISRHKRFKSVRMSAACW